MKTNLLTYDHTHRGSTTILVDVPEIPVDITIFDHSGFWAGVILVSPADRNVVQVGPGDPHGTGVKVRAVTSEAVSIRSLTGVLRNSFSLASSSGGSVIQCAGSLSMGITRDPRLTLTVARGSFLDMRNNGPVKVSTPEGQEMTLEDAFDQGLLDVKFQNEL